MRSALLLCGIVAPLVYVATDVACGFLYPGYSFADQAVSELFAICAPTSHIAVPLFSVSSLLLGAFAFGVWLSSGDNRFLRLAAAMFAGSALVGAMLWNFFPMHMRGAETSFTDTMHLVLAINPFVLLSIAFCFAAFGGAFRLYTGATITILLVPAIFAFTYAPEVNANLPTPGLGLSERVAQYAYELWQTLLATVLLWGGTTKWVGPSRLSDFVRRATRQPPNEQLQRTVRDKVPSHLGQRAAAELRR